MSAEDITHTYQEWKYIWQTLSGYVIKDPDGFSEDGITEETKFTCAEFRERAARCTVQG